MNPRRRPFVREQGFTLVELMVALLIALFLMGGLISVVGAMRRMQGAQNSLATLQDNERLAMTLVTNIIESAGYYPSPQSYTTGTEFPLVAPYAMAGQYLYGSGAGNAVAPGDTIYVRYETAGSDNVLDCTGNATTTKQVFAVQLTIDQATGDLVCYLNGNATAIHLVTGINSLQIYYGVQTNLALGNASADSYLDANHVTNWNNVVSVKLTLNFVNPLYGQAGQNNATIPFTRVIRLQNRPGYIA